MNNKEHFTNLLNSGMDFDEVLTEVLKELNLEAHELMLIAKKVGMNNTDLTNGANEFIEEVLNFAEKKKEFKNKQTP